MAAAAFGIPELLLNDEEAEKLGASVDRVLALYSTDVNPATMAWVGLVFTVVLVYGPRFWAVRQRWQAEDGAQPAPAAPPNVKPFPTPEQRAAAAAAPPQNTTQAPPERREGPVGTPQDLFGLGYSAALAEPL